MEPMLSNQEAERLVALYQTSPAAEEEAYNGLVEGYYAFIIKVARATLYKNSTARLIYEGLEETARDVAHDFLTEQFPRVLKKYTSGRGSLRTWIARCVTNYTIDYLRKRPKGHFETMGVEEEEWKSAALIQEVLGEEGPYAVHDRRELVAILQKYLSGLPPHYQEPIQLRFWEGMSVEEVAKTLRLPVGTVKSQLSRGLSILAQRLRADKWDQELR